MIRCLYTKRAAWIHFCMKKCDNCEKHRPNEIRWQKNQQYWVRSQTKGVRWWLYIYITRSWHFWEEEEIFWFERGCFLCTRMKFGCMPVWRKLWRWFFFHLFCLSNGLDKVIVSLCWMPMLGGKTDHEKILKIMVKTRRFSLPMLSTKGSNHWIMEILMGISHHISTVSLPRNKTLFGGGLSKKDHVSMTSRTGTAKFCFFSWGKKSGTLERGGVLPLGIPINSQPGLQCLLPTHRLIDVDCGEMWM